MAFKGNKIRPLLVELKMSIADFNSAMWPGKRSQLSHLEKCENVTSDTLERLSTLLSVPIDYWFNDMKPEEVLKGDVIASYNFRSNISVEMGKEIISVLKDTLEAKEQLIKEKDERIALLQQLLHTERKLE